MSVNIRSYQSLPITWNRAPVSPVRTEAPTSVSSLTPAAQSLESLQGLLQALKATRSNWKYAVSQSNLMDPHAAIHLPPWMFDYSKLVDPFEAQAAARSDVNINALRDIFRDRPSFGAVARPDVWTLEDSESWRGALADDPGLLLQTDNPVSGVLK